MFEPLFMIGMISVATSIILKNASLTECFPSALAHRLGSSTENGKLSLDSMSPSSSYPTSEQPTVVRNCLLLLSLVPPFYSLFDPP